MKKFILCGVILSTYILFSTAMAADEHSASGKINSIDRSEKTINISHGAIAALGMAAMSMDFSVADPAMLDDVKPGQKIDFIVTTDSRGRFVVVDLE